MFFAVGDVIRFLKDRRGEGIYPFPTSAWATLYLGWECELRRLAGVVH